MARIELEIIGNATGLSRAFKQSDSIIGGLQTKVQNLQKNLQNATNERDIVRYNLRLKEAQAELDKVTRLGTQAASANRALSSSNTSLSQSIQGLTRNISGANTVGIEFSRIIQDAPYGIIGVGNNITQLTQSFANLRAQTGGTSQALGIAFRSMFSGANLLVLGVSAVTTGFTLYNMWARKNKKDTDALNDSTKTYVETLKGVERAQADGLISAEKDLTSLRLLYEATQNLTLPMESRRKAAEELISQYPRQFQGLTQEAILAGKAADAYRKLSDNLIATATAMASVDRIRENSNKILNNRLQMISLQNEANELAVQIAKERSNVVTDEGALQQLGTVNALESRRQKILEQINTLGTESGSINAENIQLQGEYNSQIEKGADLSGKLGRNIEGGSKALSAAVKLQEQLNKLREQSILAGLSGYSQELQASKFRYDELRRQAEEFYRKGEISAKQYADTISRILGFEVAERGRITGGAGSVPLGQRPSTTGVVPTQLPNQIAQVDMSTSRGWDEFVDELDEQLSRSVQHFGRDFLRTLSTINQQANVTFGGIVSTLVGSLTGGITEIMTNVFTKQLGESIKDAFSDEKLGEIGTKLAAGAGIAGSIISGSTKRTSVVGQGLGGAIGGAGAGAMIGSVIPGIGNIAGAVAGGIVGLLSGALGAASAQKIQQEQLSEQRKQTALLERQNALSYASAIKGQMTAGGAVTGITRNATGQLVATVSGEQIQFVLQRSGGNRSWQ